MLGDANRWTSQIFNQGKTQRLGYFNSDIEAARAYDEAARTLHGERAKVNFNLDGTRNVNVSKMRQNKSMSHGYDERFAASMAAVAPAAVIYQPPPPGAPPALSPGVALATGNGAGVGVGAGLVAGVVAGAGVGVGVGASAAEAGAGANPSVVPLSSAGAGPAAPASRIVSARELEPLANPPAPPSSQEHLEDAAAGLPAEGATDAMDTSGGEFSAEGQEGEGGTDDASGDAAMEVDPPVSDAQSTSQVKEEAGGGEGEEEEEENRLLDGDGGEGDFESTEGGAGGEVQYETDDGGGGEMALQLATPEGSATDAASVNNFFRAVFGPNGPKSRWLRLMYSLCMCDSVPTPQEWADYDTLVSELGDKREEITIGYINQMPKKGTTVVRVWESVEEVAKYFKVPPAQVRNVAEGRKKSTLGHRWVPASASVVVLPEAAREQAVARLQGSAGGGEARAKLAAGTSVFTVYGEGQVVKFRPADRMYVGWGSSRSVQLHPPSQLSSSCC